MISLYNGRIGEDSSNPINIDHSSIAVNAVAIHIGCINSLEDLWLKSRILHNRRKICVNFLLVLQLEASKKLLLK